MAARVLYQFPISHYCEKVRWVLDHKRLPYRVHNQLPGPHMFTNRRLTGQTTVPLLIEGDVAMSGSHVIALHLDARYPSDSLMPRSAAARTLQAELIQHCDDVVAPAVRQYLYGLIIRHPPVFREIFFRDYRGAAKLIGQLIARPISQSIASMYKVHSAAARAVPEQLRRSADRIEQQLRDDSPYLLDDTFSLSDITVASLIGPVIGPPGSPWAIDVDIDEVMKLREEFSARPIGRYITARYAERMRSTAQASA